MRTILLQEDAIRTSHEPRRVPTEDGPDTGKLPRRIGIADDVIVHGKTEDEHDGNLHNLMIVAREQGLLFNSTKCSIKTKTVSFFGALYDEEGVHPDPKRVEGIKAIQSPSNIKELQNLLGIITYMGPFIPNLSHHTAHLRELLKTEAEFKWSGSHEKNLTKIKDIITAEKTLAYFNPTKETTIQVDASMKALGAVLMQEGCPIAFTSKALTETEQR